MKWMFMNKELLIMYTQSIPEDKRKYVTLYMQVSLQLNCVVYWSERRECMDITIYDTEYFKDEDEVTCITKFKGYILEKSLEN